MSLSLSRTELGAIASGAGVMIRYGFYAIAAAVLAMVGIGIATAFTGRVKTLDTRPAFRLATPELARLRMTSHVSAGERIGRIEMRQYGQLHDRNTNLTAILVMPPQHAAPAGDFVLEMRDMRALTGARAALHATYYDLETRFGDVRAADLHVDADGRRKLCLGFLTRFETAAVYLKGWYCQASGEKPNPHALACILDKLTLDAPLASKEADAFLRDRMTRGASCAATPVSQTADTRRKSVSPPSRWSRPAARH